jgi:hypothetical protein
MTPVRRLAGTRSSLRTRGRPRLAVVVLVVAGVVVACGSGDPPPGADRAGPTEPTVPPPSTIVTGAPSAGLEEAAASLFTDPMAPAPGAPLDVLAASGDVRFAWDLAERLRYQPPGPDRDPIVEHLGELMGVELPTPGSPSASAETDPWAFYVDILLAWDVPTPPHYLDHKRILHLAHDPAAAPFFESGADLDWRLVSTTGAARDEVAPLDDPRTVTAETAAAGAPDEGADDAWLPADEPVYGVQVAGEWRAYPRRVLRAHELVNDTVGQRRIVVGWCDVCGAAVGWYADASRDPATSTDDRDTEGTARDDTASAVDAATTTTVAADGLGTLAFGSSGLARRGAPLAYETTTSSLFDLYLGRAVSGRMAEAGVALEPLAVVATTWADWSTGHPATTVIAADGGVGRIYLDEPFDPPSPAPWPVGPRDDRLGADDQVLGIRTADGQALAFPADAAHAALDDDDRLTWAGVDVTVEGGGLVARDHRTSRPLPSHESNWAAWSQFQPETGLWRPGS